MFHLSFGVFAASLESDNELTRRTVKGKQATAVERVECLFLPQLNTLPRVAEAVIQAQL